MIVKLLTEHYFEFLSLKGGCTGSSESTLVKMSHCWRSHVTAHFICNHMGTFRIVQVTFAQPGLLNPQKHITLCNLTTILNV